jgi:hypothetical protein
LEACRLGRWVAAADLFEVVGREQRTGEQWLCLARAEVNVGRWVAALDSFEQAEDVGTSVETPGDKSITVGVARAERRKLMDRLSWVSVVLDGMGLRDVTVSLDGEEIPLARLGVPFAVMPGERSFALRLDGEVERIERVQLREGERRVVPFSAAELPADERTPVSRAPRARRRAPLVPCAPAQAVASQTRLSPEASALRAGGRTALIVSGISLAGGLGLAAIVANTGGKDRATTAISGGAIASGVSLIVSAVLYGLSATTESPPARPRPAVEPYLGLGTAGVAGRF